MADDDKTAVAHTDASTGETSAPADAKDGAPKTSADGKALMAIKVYAPFKVYYEGQAESLTAENETGPFDILPKHHNFFMPS